MVGLIAGWGNYPVVVAKALKRAGRRVCCVGVRGHADPVLADICDEFAFRGLAKLGGAIRYFRRHRVRTATMAGKIHKTILFERFAWVRHVPDLRCAITFFPHFVSLKKDRKDDTMLMAVVDAYANAGITLVPATDFAPELLVKSGVHTKRSLSATLTKDVEFGWQLAKEMGGLDVGQTVVVKGRAVLAVEAVEGTDACIRRAGALCPQGDFTVVKVAKPQQDMRFDVPTIGLGTLETIAAAGGGVLAVEAEKTILIDREAVLQFAAKHRIAIVACSEESIRQTISRAA